MEVLRAIESQRAAQIAMLPHVPNEVRQQAIDEWSGTVAANRLDGDAAEFARQGLLVREWPDEWPDEART
jgi:hypothetical protein